ncbi:glycosyltransferase [Streptomonospora sp. S1-112]|uniref:Glycosyltransferase n=1 Tax=Streptomonospora mangrovi TaxID=2883123 RepID=A0A9X3SEH3_9ACTN|nr:glycosyltransferase [Streptomonospora mangrovi]MDA0563790.1 glycosyltransferase [Streptomonospora mangrovi]
MIVLVVRDISPGAVGGAVLRNRALLAALRAVADVRVVPVATGEPRPADAPPPPDLGFRDPFAADHHPVVAARLAELVRRPEVEAVVVSESRLHRYFRIAVEAGCTAVLDLHDAESLLWAEAAEDPRLSAEVRARVRREHDVAALRAIESYAARHAAVVTFVSLEDEERYRAQYRPAAATAVVPNSVRVPAPPPERLRRPLPGPRLLFLGHLGYIPNADAVDRLTRDIFPAVRAAFPDAALTVAGRVPGKGRTRSSPGAGTTLLENPAEVEPLFDGTALVVPLALGSGTRLKILEAFAAGVPVLSTAKGAEGLDAVAGTHYLGVGLDPESHVRAVADLLGDPAADLRRRAAAYDLVRDRYSWSALEEPVRALLDRLRGRRAGYSPQRR